MIILAAAMGLHHELGQESGAPLWNLPDEYNRFRQSIRNHPVIFGRKSFDVVKTPLEDSLNIVITRQENYDGHGAVVVHSLDEAIGVAKKEGTDIYVVGGGYIFDMAIGLADRMEISVIEARFPDANAFFPEFSTDQWELISSERHETDSRHAYPFEFQIWRRRKM
ncbi:MAG: dihydrofolate reductase [Chitinophagaceae bacterium]|nr:dihydrofolate reductase [Chitinophagaceae bacterium]